MSQNIDNIQPHIGTKKVTKYRWVVLVLAVLMTIICNADRANFGSALPFIRQEMSMSNTEAGALMSLFFFGYAAMQLPGGFINSKFGMRKVLSVSVIITSVVVAGLAWAHNVTQLQALRLAIGIAEGPMTVGLIATINNWFPVKEKGTATGILIAGTKAGPLIVPPICALVVSIWGWREIFLVFAIPGIVAGIVWYLMVTNHPTESRFCSPAEADYILTGEKAVAEVVKPKKPYNLRWVDKIIRAKKVQPLDTNAKLFTSWNLIGDSLAFAFMAGIVVIMMSWLPTYLLTVKKLSIMTMAFAAAAPFAGTVLGNILGGWIGDNLLNKRRKPLMLLTSLSTCVMMLFLLNAPSDPTLLGIILFMTGVLLALGYNGFFSYPMGLTTKEKFPIAEGIMQTGGQFGGAVAPLLVGIILDKYSWDMVFISLAVGSIICSLIVFSIIEPVDDPLV
jgi:sugar phosphate permease